ncbi:hypothetical protein [Erwinia mallotivora]|uniref:hypothetical protein n=1 Tax=Erwinia mallotivora TaxID=69222 RepID=UPI0021C18F2B|nr:hypothetical protein [Erwinia mallotivora]
MKMLVNSLPLVVVFSGAGRADWRFSVTLSPDYVLHPRPLILRTPRYPILRWVSGALHLEIGSAFIRQAGWQCEAASFSPELMCWLTCSPLSLRVIHQRLGFNRFNYVCIARQTATLR